jgi:hypothetical protein
MKIVAYVVQLRNSFSAFGLVLLARYAKLSYFLLSFYDLNVEEHHLTPLRKVLMLALDTLLFLWELKS